MGRLINSPQEQIRSAADTPLWVNSTDANGAIAISDSAGSVALNTTSAGLTISTGGSADLPGDSSALALTIGSDKTSTFTGTIGAPASTATIPSMHVAPGVAPTAPADGDIWVDSSGFYCRVNGETATLSPTAAGVSISGTPANNQIGVWTSANEQEGDPMFTYTNASFVPKLTIGDATSFAISPTIEFNGAANASHRITYKQNGGELGEIAFFDNVGGRQNTIRIKANQGVIQMTPNNTTVAIFELGVGMDILNGGVRFNERASAPATPTSTTGQLWVKNDPATKLYYTDNEGTDFLLSKSDNPVDLAVYCPGYTPVFVDADTFTINGFDVRPLFHVGRRLLFTDNSTAKYGSITSNTIGAGNTTINVTMEAGASLTALLTEVCLTTNATMWVPIVDDPFSGTSINDVTTGQIGATNYVVIVGDGGRLAYSTDGGVNYTVATTGTTEILHKVAYNETNEEFLAVGNANVLLRSTNGTTWTLDTATMSALNAGGTGNCYDVIWWADELSWCVTHALSATPTSRVVSLDNDLTNAVSQTNTAKSVEVMQLALYYLDSQADRLFLLHDDDISYISTVASSSLSYSVNLGAIINETQWVLDPGGAVRYISCLIDGVMNHSGGSHDNVTFTGSMNDICWSGLHERAVAVGVSGQIGYIDKADINTVDSWTTVGHGFDPLVELKCVCWDPITGVFIAGAANGQIARSATGIA